jgi:hypothetical protein
MGYEEILWRNGVFLVEHALWHHDNIIVPHIGLLSRIVRQLFHRGFTSVARQEGRHYKHGTPTGLPRPRRQPLHP